MIPAVGGCAPPGGLDDAGEPGSPFAVAVVTFSPGEGAGFGQDRMPDVVLGPPMPGASTSEGGLDVVSLGRGGVIVVEMGLDVEDGDGADLIVFENPFESALGSFTEAGEVAVSEDGETFVAFPCAPDDEPPNGCAGYGIVYAHPDTGIDPTDPEAAGGDAFDLADVGVARARFVRVVDRARASFGGESEGFDLDAVAVARR